MASSQVCTVISVEPATRATSRSKLLRDAGYRVIEVADNEAAVRRVSQEGNSLLLLQNNAETTFRVLADNTPALLWVNGPDGCEFVNRAYLDFLGVMNVDVRGYDWAQFVHPDDRKQYVTAYLEAVVERRLFDTTFRFLRYDGEYRRMKSVGMPRFGADGMFLGYVGSTIDITDLHRTTNKPQVGKWAPGYYQPGVWDIDLLMNRVQWSEAYYELYGIPREVTPSHESWIARIYPQDRARVEAEFAQTVAKCGALRIEFRIVRDGQIRWLRSEGQVTCGTDGAPIRVAGMTWDITEPKQGEEALTGQKRLYQSVTDNASVALFIMDEHQHCVFMNPAAEQLTGYCLAETLGRPLHEVVHHTRPNGRPYPLSECPIDQAFPERNKMQGEEVFVHKDGHFYHVAFTASPILDEGDRPVGTVIEVQDITGQKQSEAALIASEGRLKLFIEHAPAAIAMFDRAMRYLAVSRRFMTDYGITSHPIGRSHYEIFTEMPERWKAVHRRALAGEVLRADADPFHRLDGSIQYIKWEVRPWYAEPDQIGGLLIATEEVTERVKAAERLRESEERFRNVFEHAATGIAIADMEGHFLQCNQSYCAMLGYTEEELHQQNKVFVDLVHPEDRAANWAEFQRLLQGGLSFFEIENRYVHKQGTPVWVHKFVSLLRDDAGKPKYLVALVTNVTERRKTEQALLDAQECLQRWNLELEQAVNLKTAELQQSQERLRAMAMELNLAELRERKRMAAELHDHLQQLLVLGKMQIGQGKRLALGIPSCESVLQKVDGIFSQALTYTRTLVADLSPPVLRDHGLASGLRWLGESMKQHELRVTVTVPEEQTLMLPEDEMMLLFVSVRELLINTSKHAGIGEAAVDIAANERRLDITVRDEGRGFDLAAATANFGVSSTFGLFSIRERMRALGGSFELHSSPGHGTRAILSLPIISRGGAPIETSERDTTLVSDQNGTGTLRTTITKTTRVLLVDDHLMVRQGLRSILQTYQDVDVIGEASDGEEAVALVDCLLPQVVVMDLNMPKMNGIEATAIIKARHPDITVIGLSVNTSQDTQEAISKAGAAVLLNKESGLDRLYDAIRRRG